ncbi:hypothetical protein ACH61_02882 [Rathayibacter tanaceti]|uniref:Uncharacterized protein n=1 Tax=Rathayibacter tanaceti TaxID=1671680 RepID=A0A166H638_9MICO|nr:hypothetical protein ACH61_02882 [Rathayibacter tanaceti]
MADPGDGQVPQRRDRRVRRRAGGPLLEARHHLAQQLVDLPVPRRIMGAHLAGDDVGGAPLGGQHLLHTQLHPAPDGAELRTLGGVHQAREGLDENRVQLVGEGVDPLGVAEQPQRAGEGPPLARGLHHVLSALEVLAEHLAGRAHVAAQVGDHVALHRLDRLGDPREVRRQFTRQVHDVLGLLEQLLVVGRLDPGALLERRDLTVQARPLLAEARQAGLRVGLDVGGEALDRLQQRAHPRVRHAGATASGAPRDLERADGVGAEAVHLRFALDLRHQPADAHPVAAHVAGRPGRQSPLALVVAGRAQLLQQLADLGVRVGDGDHLPVDGEHEREGGDDEGGVAAVQEIERRGPERAERAQVGGLGARVRHRPPG